MRAELIIIVKPLLWGFLAFTLSFFAHNNQDIFFQEEWPCSIIVFIFDEMLEDLKSQFLAAVENSIVVCRHLSSYVLSIELRDDTYSAIAVGVTIGKVVLLIALD